MSEKRGRIIAVVNNKGGVGKSTVCTNLGHALAARSKKVLVVDLDSQCNASKLLMKTSSPEASLYDILDDEKHTEISSCIYPSQYKRLFILPNEETVSALEIDLIIGEKFDLLRTKLKDYVADNFDYVFLDCPPNLLYFVISALWMSDYAIIPVVADSRFSLDGLYRMLTFIDEQRETNNVNLRFLKAVINMVDKRMTLSKIIQQQLMQKLGADGIFETTIPSNSSVKQAEYVMKTVLSHSASSKGAKAFRCLAEELENILGQENELAGDSRSEAARN